MSLPTSCKPGCGHTAAEHTAFDAGLKAGAKGYPEIPDSTYNRGQRNAYLAGYTTGKLNKEFAARKQP